MIKILSILAIITIYLTFKLIIIITDNDGFGS